MIVYYVIDDPARHFLSLSQAKKAARELSVYAETDIEVHRLSLKVSPQTIMNILNGDGYADSTKTVFIAKYKEGRS